jgi:hypothetical protein
MRDRPGEPGERAGRGPVVVVMSGNLALTKSAVNHHELESTFVDHVLTRWRIDPTPDWGISPRSTIEEHLIQSQTT